MESIWTKTPEVTTLNEICKNTGVSHLGINFTEVGPNYIKATMPVDHRTIQPAGLLHGGISVALAESLGSVASSFCNESSDLMPVGVEINANHVRSARSGFVTGTVKPIHLGRSLHVWEIQVTDEQSKLCSISRLTVTLVSKKRTS